MTVDGKLKEVESGDVIVNKPFSSHELENPFDEKLKILVFEVYSRQSLEEFVIYLGEYSWTMFRVLNKIKKGFYNFIRIKTHSMKTGMIVYFSMISIVALTILGVITYLIYSNTMNTDILNYTSSIADQVSLNMDNYLGQVETSIKVLSQNGQIISYFKDFDTNTSFDNLSTRRNINKTLNDLQTQNPDIFNILFYNRSLYVDAISEQSPNLILALLCMILTLIKFKRFSVK